MMDTFVLGSGVAITRSGLFSFPNFDGLISHTSFFNIVITSFLSLLCFWGGSGGTLGNRRVFIPLVLRICLHGLQSYGCGVSSGDHVSQNRLEVMISPRACQSERHGPQQV